MSDETQDLCVYCFAPVDSHDENGCEQTGCTHPAVPYDPADP